MATHDLEMVLERMPEGEIGVDLVPIAAAHLGVAHVSGILQLSDDPLGRPLGDPDPFGDLTDEHVGVLRDAEQHVRVVRHEGPVSCGHRHDHTSMITCLPLREPPDRTRTRP